MSILEGVRAANIKAEKPKFIIKARNNPKDGKEDYEPEPSYATDEDAIQFMEYMINKSQRLRQLIDKKAIITEAKFYQSHLFGSTCLKTLVKQTLDKMMGDRRLGKNLKGMNRSNLNEIEGIIWTMVERQANLYINQLQYARKKRQLENDLKSRKEQLLLQIDKISENRSRRGSQSTAQERQGQI